MSDIIALSQNLGAGHAVFNRYIGRPLPGMEANEQELRAAIAAVEQASHNGSSGRVKFGTPIPHCFTPNSSNGCMAGFVHFTIDPWGNLRPCPHVPLIAGNVLNGRSLEAVLRGRMIEEWQRGYLAQCEACASRGDCFAGCRAMAMLRGMGSDPLVFRCT